MSILEIVKSTAQGSGYSDVYEFLIDECKEVHRERKSEQRWWDNYFVVVEFFPENSVKAILIGFVGAENTGDSSLSEVGWKFNENSICEVYAEKETITVYRKVKA
jgi:hypothetical protein